MSVQFPGLDQKYISQIMQRLQNIPAQFKVQAQQLMYSDYYQQQKMEKDQAERQEMKNQIMQKTINSKNGDEKTITNANLKIANLADMIRKKYHIDLTAGDDQKVVNDFVDQLPDGNKLLLDYINGKNSKLLTKSGLVENKTFSNLVALNEKNKVDNVAKSQQPLQTLQTHKNVENTTLKSSSHFDDDNYASNYLARQGAEWSDFIDGARNAGYIDGEIASVIDAKKTYDRLQAENKQRQKEYENRGYTDKMEEANIGIFQGITNFFANAYNNLFANNPSIGLTHTHNIDMDKINFSDDLLGAGNNIGDLRANSGWSKGGNIAGDLIANVALMRLMPSVGGGTSGFGVENTLKTAAQSGRKGIIKEAGERALIGGAEGGEFGLLASMGQENLDGERLAENIGGGALFGSVFGVGGEGLNLRGAYKNGLSGILKESGNIKTLNTLKDQFYKSIKPTSRGVKTTSQVDKYNNDAIDSIELIVKNKNNLRFVDANGEETIGQLPRTVDEFAQAIKQTKERLYADYNQIVKQAGKDATVDTKKIVNELKALKNDKERLAGQSEATKNEIDKWIRDLEALDNKMSVEGVQKKTQELNDELTAFMKSNNPNDVGPNTIKAKVNNGLKEGINDSIENAGLDSVEYQNLKRSYGALKTIESDVNHRAIVYGRQNPESLVDSLSNLSSVDAIANFMKDPVKGTTKLIGSQLEKISAKSRNNPNNIVKKMFGDAEKTVEKNSTLKTKAQQEAQASADAQARQEASIKKAREERASQREWLSNRLNEIKAENESKYQAYQERLQSRGVGSETKALPENLGVENYNTIIGKDPNPITVTPEGTSIRQGQIAESPTQNVNYIKQQLKNAGVSDEQIEKVIREIEAKNAKQGTLFGEEVETLGKKSGNVKNSEYNIGAKGADTDARLKFDTKGEGFSKLRSKKADYMIVSAENPMGQQASSEFNAKTTEEFRKFLDENGIKWKAQKGMYNNPENSQLIAIDNPKQRALIDKRLETHSKQQENMIIKNGYAYRYDPRTNEAYKVDLKKADIDLPAETDNFYSEIDGRKYQLPLYGELEQPITVEEFLSIYNS